MQYITAREYSPLKIDKSEITLNGMKYTKSSNGKWMDEQNKEQDIRQEDIRLYYYNNTTGKAEILPQNYMVKMACFLWRSRLYSLIIRECLMLRGFMQMQMRI